MSSAGMCWWLTFSRSFMCASCVAMAGMGCSSSKSICHMSKICWVHRFMSRFCGSSSVFSPITVSVYSKRPQRSTAVMYIQKKRLSALAISFSQTGPILLWLKADTLPELPVELNLMPDWRNGLTQLWCHFQKKYMSGAILSLSFQIDTFLVWKKKWQELMQNDCWHHCTVCNKQKVPSDGDLKWVLQASWNYFKWTEPGSLKSVKCILIYYMLLMQLLVHVKKEHKKVKETQVGTLWHWKSALESTGAVVGVVGRHLHLFSTSLNWDLDSAHTKIFFFLR